MSNSDEENGTEEMIQRREEEKEGEKVNRFGVRSDTPTLEMEWRKYEGEVGGKLDLAID